jgi:hypothetical protein
MMLGEMSPEAISVGMEVRSLRGTRGEISVLNPNGSGAPDIDVLWSTGSTSRISWRLEHDDPRVEVIVAGEAACPAE